VNLNAGKGGPPWFKWSFLPAGVDLRDPLLSPIFAKRENLPPKACVIGCELDSLCAQDEDMAEFLAEGEEAERKALTVGTGWEKGAVRWEKVLGWGHGWDHDEAKCKGEREAERMKSVREVHGRVAEWLLREVYA